MDNSKFQVECAGGGRILHEAVAKRITVFGYSQVFLPLALMSLSLYTSINNNVRLIIIEIESYIFSLVHSNMA